MKRLVSVTAFELAEMMKAATPGNPSCVGGNLGGKVDLMQCSENALVRLAELRGIPVPTKDQTND